MTEIGALPQFKESVPAAINDAGQVAGTSSAGLEASSAFLYDASKKTPMEELGLKPQGAINRAFGISDTGVVVGDSSMGSDSTRHAVIFRRGWAMDLGTMKKAGPYSRATGVNSSEQVVGFAGAARDHHASRAFVWSASTGMLDLGTFGGPFAQALAINDAGFVTGWAQTEKSELGEGHAFLHQPFSGRLWRMRDLGTLGGTSSYGTAINKKNHVVGYSSINEENNLHAFLHDGVTMRDLGTLGGKSVDADHSVALGVNSNDEVVGYSFLDSEIRGDGPALPPQQVAFIFRDGAMMNLNQLIGRAAKNYLLYSAVAINDKGQIAALAYVYAEEQFRAVLLTPAAPDPRQ